MRSRRDEVVGTNSMATRVVHCRDCPRIYVGVGLVVDRCADAVCHNRNQVNDHARALMKPYYQDDAVTIYHGDCREVLPSLGQVDHVITDPPYEKEAHTKGRRIVNPRTGELRMAPLTFAEMTAELRDEVTGHIAKARRWALVFCQIEAAMTWRAALERSGMRYMRTMVWVKPNGQPQLTGDRPGVGFESIVVGHAAPASRWNGGGARGYLQHSVDANFSRTPRYHETQKPETLMRELVQMFTDPGETILDPFIGSGTTLIAAKRLGRKAIGIELEERYCEIAAKRLAQGALDLFGASA